MKIKTLEEAVAVGGSDNSELQTTLQLVANLQNQLKTMKEETSDREKNLQAEVERLNSAEHSQENSTGQLKR